MLSHSCSYAGNSPRAYVSHSSLFGPTGSVAWPTHWPYWALAPCCLELAQLPSFDIELLWWTNNQAPQDPQDSTAPSAAYR